MKGKLVIAGLLVSLLTLSLMACAKAPTPAPTPVPTPAPTPTLTPPPAPVEWKGLRPWALETADVFVYRELIKRVNERSAGRLVIKDLGGSEVISSTAQFAPLKTGLVDLLLTSTGYIADKYPEGNAMMYGFGATPDKLRAGGVYAKLDEIALKEHGVRLLGIGAWYSAHVWLTKPINGLADLKTMKMRSHPAYDPLLKGLGVPTVTISFGEVYTALERGVIDGMAWSGGISEYGLQKVLKYRIDPPFWRAGWVPIMVNAKSLDALPADLQKLVIDTMLEIEKDITKTFDDIFTKMEAPALKEAGIRTAQLSQADWLETQRIAWEKGLPETLAKVSPAYGQELIKLLSRFYPPKEAYPEVPVLD
ncbi:MAG: TRAP transporter substrate-binding protein DctP [Chloroflexi bacterium]|nr:TRAP transporter substrate-binding protein DctP [Chloroflexota bacterium]